MVRTNPSKYGQVNKLSNVLVKTCCVSTVPKLLLAVMVHDLVGSWHVFILSIQADIHRYPIYSLIYARHHMTEWIGDGDGKSLAAIIGCGRCIGTRIDSWCK